MPSGPPRFVLGFDAGGSATRWALAAADGTIAAEGEAAPASGLQMLSADGRAALADALRQRQEEIEGCEAIIREKVHGLLSHPVATVGSASELSSLHRQSSSSSPCPSN